MDKATEEQSHIPRVSIVIPSYNRRDDLIGVLESLKDQTFTDFEIVVVDDGSQDGLCELDVAAYDSRARLIIHLNNRGGSAARNSGIDAARAPLIALLDSDDRWEPHKLDRQIAVINNEQLTDTDFLIASDVWMQFEDQLLPHNSRSPTVGEPLDHYLVRDGQALQTSTMLLPTDLAQRVRFREGLRRHQDWDFALRIVQAGARLVYIPEQLATYNLDPDPARVSRQKGRFAATLAWFQLCDGLVSVDAMRAYFLRSAIGRPLLNESSAVLKGAWWLIRQERAGLPRMVTGFARELRNRLARR